MIIHEEFFKYFLKKETKFLKKLARFFVGFSILAIILFLCEILINEVLFSYLRFILFIIAAVIVFFLIRNSFLEIKAKILEDIDINFVHLDKIVKLKERIEKSKDTFRNNFNFNDFKNFDLIIKKLDELDDLYIKSVQEKGTVINFTNELLDFILGTLGEFNFFLLNEFISKFNEKDVFLVKLLRNSFCLNCTFVQIYSEFFNIVNKRLEDELKFELENIEKLKKNYLFLYSEIENISHTFVKDIEETLKSYDLSTGQIQLFYKDYAKMSEELEKALSYYYDEFKKIDLILENVENISEQTRIIALNLSIEASKSSKNAFNVISKELQNLSIKTQEFIRNISLDIKNSIKRIEEEKDEKLRIIKIINENVQKNKEINDIFSSNIKNLIDVSIGIKKDIELILNDKEKLFSLFDLIQNFYFELEIAKTISSFYLEFQRENSEKVHEMLGGKKGLCANEEDKKKYIKPILEKIRSKITTKLEKDALNEIYLKYTNETIDNKYLEDDKDVIIF